MECTSIYVNSLQFTIRYATMRVYLVAKGGNHACHGRFLDSRGGSKKAPTTSRYGSTLIASGGTARIQSCRFLAYQSNRATEVYGDTEQQEIRQEALILSVAARSFLVVSQATRNNLVSLCYLMLFIVPHVATHFKQEVVLNRYFCLESEAY